ncbi:M14 family metallopeptidase [Jeotgalibacillus sp. S-D1]|uniref:M14 family metallopeptidase n=1 Tax=Jeotgalibacillus sp. S-D1 TaxID=2552189 RepID=UPI001F0FB0A8|nr:M14 family zinc carboxypeptidase [Jeotgalibacillus sp. S-D1]
MKKVALRWLAIMMMLTLAFPASLGFTEEGNAQAGEVTELEVSRTAFSLTETRTVEVRADLGAGVDPEEVNIQFGGKDLAEWKKWSGGTNYNGEPFIKVIDGPAAEEGSNEVTATIEFGLLYDRTDLSNRTIRVQYQQFIGDYELALVDAESGAKASAEVSLNVYDEFTFYDEIKPAIDEVFAEAEADGENGRYLEYQSLGKSAEGRDLHFVILAKDKEAVDTYLNETLPQALEDPKSLLKKLKKGKMGDYQIPVWFNNIHPDETEGVDAQIELFKKFALEDEVTFTNAEEENKEAPVTMNVDEVLDDTILLYMFTNNPDGRVANTRANSEGFDLNRDNANQTQVESRQVTEAIAKWTPLSFVDMHGYVDGFLVEPGTPPHNPNFEYDLLIDNMLDQAHAMGKAGVGNSDLTSYFIPLLEWEDGWDDMTPAYTPMYAMLHGALGHTVEVPTLSQDSLNAMVGVGLGATHFVTENKDELYKEQLEIFKRGVTGEDNRAVDQYYVNAAGEEIGRNRNGNDSFFPDYYVLPADKKNQKNPLEAHKMAEYLLRNGIKVEKSTKKVKVNGTSYPKGTYIVPMDQAKRGLANAVLYKGDNVSDWNAMYDPVVVNFPDLRGFDLIEVRKKGLFEGNTKEIDEVTIPTGKVKGNPPKQLLKNGTNDTIKVVNALLADGKTVEVITERKGKAEKGDYIVSSKDLRSYNNEYYFDSVSAGNGKNLKTSILTQPQVAATGSAQLKFSLKELGFELVDQKEADVIVSDGGALNQQELEGKSYIGIGANALNAVQNSGLLSGFNFNYTRSNHEGLVKANVSKNLITAGYEKEELLYVATGSWITGVPEEADVLLSYDSADDFYVAGWWPGNEAAKGQTMAITQETEATEFTLFANELAYRGHTQHSHRLLANSIFHSVAEETKTTKKKPKSNKGKKGKSITVDNIKIDRSKDKVKAAVGKDALVKAAKSAQQVDRFTISSDRNQSSDLIEVTIPSSDIRELKQSQPDAKIEVQSDDSSYLIPLSSVKLENAADLKDKDFTVSIEISEEEETYAERELEKRKVKGSHVKVTGKSGNKTAELARFKSFTEESGAE